MYSFLDKKILNIKMYFCNISATIVKTSCSKIFKSEASEKLEETIMIN